ncbi:MAG: cytochrome P450 [Parvibaculaceae bacterium]|jgi:cytochrome P450
MLKPVTQTYQQDEYLPDPAYAPAYNPPADFDLTDALSFTQGQPFEFFKRLRDNAPVAWVPIPKLAGFWALSKYEDVKRVELDPETFSSQVGGILQSYGKEGTARHEKLHSASLNTLICLDRPNHIQLRMQHRGFFTPAYIAELQKKVAVKVDSLLDEMEAKGPVVDMVEMFSSQLPLFTLCEMLGIEEKDRAKVVRWMHYLEVVGYVMAERESGGKVNPIFIAKLLWNVRQMFAFGKKLMEDRRKNPRDDLISAIAKAEVEGEPLSPEFLDGSWLLIIFAGNDTTRNTLSGTMRLLTQFPDEKQKLLDNPDLMPNMVHEAIRMVSPVMYMRRTLTKDVEMSGQKMAAGEKVVMYYGAANRDPEIFENPDQFQVERENASKHIAFGLGPHVCLGQRIAMMQLDTAYRKILERFPNARWTGKQTMAPNNFVHAISHLEVDLGTGS